LDNKAKSKQFSQFKGETERLSRRSKRYRGGLRFSVTRNRSARVRSFSAFLIKDRVAVAPYSRGNKSALREMAMADLIVILP
jgi:hypothetical protein